MADARSAWRNPNLIIGSDKTQRGAVGIRRRRRCDGGRRRGGQAGWRCGRGGSLGRDGSPGWGHDDWRGRLMDLNRS
jgi:hypothetical protein